MLAIEYLDDRRRLKAYLNDYFKGNTAIVNSMLIALDAGVIEEIRNQDINRNCINKQWINWISKKIEYNYGIKLEMAYYATMSWVIFYQQHAKREGIVEEDLRVNYMIDDILNNGIVKSHRCVDYLNDNKTLSAVKSESGNIYYYALLEEVTVQDRAYVDHCFLFYNYPEINNVNNILAVRCYHLNSFNDRIDQNAYRLSDQQIAKLRSMLTPLDLYSASNVDIFVRKTNELFNDIAEGIEKNGYKWIKDKTDNGDDILYVETSIITKACELFPHEKNVVSRFVIVSGIEFLKGHYIVYLDGINLRRRTFCEASIRNFFVIWGLDTSCIDRLAKSKSHAKYIEEKEDREYAVFRRCLTKQDFLRESTEYFDNDFQASEFRDQCCMALSYKEDEEDEIQYEVDFLNEYYYSLFLDRNDMDGSIYEEINDLAHDIFSEMHNQKTRDALFERELAIIRRCSSKEQYIKERRAKNSDSILYFDVVFANEANPNWYERKNKEIDNFWEEYYSEINKLSDNKTKKDFVNTFLKNHYYYRGIQKYDEDGDIYDEYVDRAIKMYNQIRRQ